LGLTEVDFFVRSIAVRMLFIVRLLSYIVYCISLLSDDTMFILH